MALLRDASGNAISGIERAVTSETIVVPGCKKQDNPQDFYDESFERLAKIFPSIGYRMCDKAKKTAV